MSLRTRATGGWPRVALTLPAMSRRAVAASWSSSTSSIALWTSSSATPRRCSSADSARRERPRLWCLDSTQARAKAGSSIRPASVNRSRTASAAGRDVLPPQRLRELGPAPRLDGEQAQADLPGGGLRVLGALGAPGRSVRVLGSPGERLPGPRAPRGTRPGRPGPPGCLRPPGRPGRPGATGPPRATGPPGATQPLGRFGSPAATGPPRCRGPPGRPGPLRATEPPGRPVRLERLYALSPLSSRGPLGAPGLRGTG